MKQKQNKKRIKNVPRYALAGSTPLPSKIVPNAAVQAYINQGTQNSLNAAGQRIAAQQAEASIGTSLENYEDAPATDDVPPADFNTQAFDDFDFNDLKSFVQDKDNISPLDEITPDEQYNGSAKIDDHLC